LSFIKNVAFEKQNSLLPPDKISIKYREASPFEKADTNVIITSAEL